MVHSVRPVVGDGIIEYSVQVFREALQTILILSQLELVGDLLEPHWSLDELVVVRGDLFVDALDEGPDGVFFA